MWPVERITIITARPAQPALPIRVSAPLYFWLTIGAAVAKKMRTMYVGMIIFVRISMTYVYFNQKVISLRCPIKIPYTLCVDFILYIFTGLLPARDQTKELHKKQNYHPLKKKLK
jgi:hypothetical protein